MQVPSTCALIVGRLLFSIRKWVYCKHLFISHLWFHSPLEHCRLLPLQSVLFFTRAKTTLCGQFSMCSFRTGRVCCRPKWNKASSIYIYNWKRLTTPSDTCVCDCVCASFFWGGGVALHPLMNMFILGPKRNGILLLGASQKYHVMVADWTLLMCYLLLRRFPKKLLIPINYLG